MQEPSNRNSVQEISSLIKTVNQTVNQRLALLANWSYMDKFEFRWRFKKRVDTWGVCYCRGPQGAGGHLVDTYLSRIMAWFFPLRDFSQKMRKWPRCRLGICRKSSPLFSHRLFHGNRHASLVEFGQCSIQVRFYSLNKPILHFSKTIRIKQCLPVVYLNSWETKTIMVWHHRIIFTLIWRKLSLRYVRSRGKKDTENAKIFPGVLDCSSFGAIYT